jgi:hypothetical protein
LISNQKKTQHKTNLKKKKKKKKKKKPKQFSLLCHIGTVIQTNNRKHSPNILTNVHT